MRHHTRAIGAIVASILFLLNLLLPTELRAHREYVHQYLAIEAYRLLLRKYPGLASTEMASHIGSQTGDCEGFPFTLATVTGGAYREVCEDPVFHYGDLVTGLDKAYFSASHFWDADAGDASTIQICDVTCGNYANAFQKTLRYVLPGMYGRWTAKLTWPAGYSAFHLQGGGTTTIFHSGLIGFEYDSLAGFVRDGRCTITGYIDITGKWQTAATVPDQLPRRIIAPKAVRDRIGWEVIGRIAHLLGDMGVPAHAHNDIHPPFWWNNEPADVFEEEMSRLYTAWTSADALSQGGLLDFRAALRPGSPASIERVMRYLVYTTNQVADRFPSNDADGDSRYDTAWDGDDYSVLNMIREISVDPRARDQFHRQAAEYAFVYSIRSIAGLLDWFAQETGLLARVSVDAGFAGASVRIDGKPRITPALFTVPAGTPFTLETTDQPWTDSLTGAALTMKFSSWIRSIPGLADAQFGEPRLSQTAVDGTRYLARFDRVVTVTLAAARHLDGGSGGRYSVDGADAGEGWIGAVNSGSAPAITVGFSPPAGSVFLAWSDGNTANPRVLRPTGNVDLRAICKRRLTSTLSPLERPPNQRLLAIAAGADGAGCTAVLTYESAGEIFFCGSTDGVTWSPEAMLSEGLGSGRDPSIDIFTEPDGQLTVVAWEELLPAGAGRRVIARTKERGAAAWSPVIVLESAASPEAVRATPVVSTDLVVWRGASGIRCRRLAGGAVFTVPGTGPGSASPVADVYSAAEGKFALCWIESGSGLWFVRGSAGGAWGIPRLVAAAVGPDQIRTADIALSANGAGCVAWTTSSSGDWKINYRQIDQADQFQTAAPFGLCPSPGGNPPALQLADHRLDAAASKDIGIHAWNPLTGTLTTLLLSSGQKIGPSTQTPEAGYPDIPHGALSRSGATPAFLSKPGTDGGWTLLPATLSFSPGLPGVPLPVSPAHGASGLGGTVTLSWLCAVDASSFAVQVGRDESFTGALVADRTGVTATSVIVQNLSPGTTYYWRVRSVNSLGSGNFTLPRAFTTAAAPSATTLSGSVVTTPNGSFPKLSWSVVAGAESYRLYRYICADPTECAAAASRPSSIYDGPLTTCPDLNNTVSPKEPSGFAFYYVVAKRAGFSGPSSNIVSFPVQFGAISSETSPLPRTSGLDANYPNPFNPSTTVTFRLADPARVTISVFNILAQRVATIFEGTKDPGHHELSWDAAGLPGGVYFLLMEASPVYGGRSVLDRKKVVLLK
jgi:hypothetical protein